MRLYRVYRTDKIGYDEFSAVVVQAESWKDAREICPSEDRELFYYWCPYKNEWIVLYDGDYWISYNNWPPPSELKVEYLGVVMGKVKRRVILASFHAG